VTPVFFDDFTGTNDDPWDSNLWTRVAGQTVDSTWKLDIQGNRGRFHAGQFSFHAQSVRAGGQYSSPIEIAFDFEMDDLGGDRSHWLDLYVMVDEETPSNGGGAGNYRLQVDNGYRLRIENHILDEGRNTRLRYRRIDNGSDTTLASITSPQIHNDTRYSVVLEITEDGSDIRHRLWVWPFGESKPVTPIIDETDDAHTEGYVFIQGINRAVPAGDDDQDTEGIALMFGEFEITEADVIVPPDTPTGFAATALSSTHNRLTWNAVDGATGYVIQRRIKVD
jgi:hypothetical protein